ncbi:hypothetical protein [Streptomyces aquilus]|uniref:hypothetical protein n=1 Tax=Streptomyces aquilus TaxID=2548456 RepID=UPI00367ED0A7
MVLTRADGETVGTAGRERRLPGCARRALSEGPALRVLEVLSPGRLLFSCRRRSTGAPRN